MAPKRINYIGFGDIHGTKAYKFIRFGDIHGPKAYKFIGLWHQSISIYRYWWHPWHRQRFGSIRPRPALSAFFRFYPAVPGPIRQCPVGPVRGPAVRQYPSLYHILLDSAPAPGKGACRSSSHILLDWGPAPDKAAYRSSNHILFDWAPIGGVSKLKPHPL